MEYTKKQRQQLHGKVKCKFKRLILIFPEKHGNRKHLKCQQLMYKDNILYLHKFSNKDVDNIIDIMTSLLLTLSLFTLNLYLTP